MDNKIANETGKQMVPAGCAASREVVPSDTVRSAAEVRHGTVHFQTNFQWLQHNTDLNIPPSNWLRSSSKLEQQVRDLTWRNSRMPSEFSSIDMANNSPDLAGEVDVITHAASIKKLLKMPFEKSHISMMVHRVGKSLLLDEFDMHKHLLRQEQVEWQWLRQFYYESIQRDLQEKMKCVPRQSKTRHNLQNRSLYSKFLYHSLSDVQKTPLIADATEFSSHTQLLTAAEDVSLIPDPLPQPMGTQYQREVLWTFEDIKMLIGTDLPVFSDDSYYVSLRLKDMRTPINVLTGLDYWLDNLMCNVPEVAMCFHIDGIVKKYEVVKTEDIPNLENSEFDPQVVTDIAKNILSFLKNNATKEGHTYWLYKGSDDEVVKLYDLTALCGDQDQLAHENPFTVPIGMLLYRVARNMWTQEGQSKAALIRTLLENCLFLLDEKEHPQVCTSACYVLSDLFVPDNSLEDDWSLPESPPSEVDSDSEDMQDSEPTEGQESVSVEVESLSASGSVHRSRELVHHKPFNKTPEDRCQEALKLIHRGLLCLDTHLNSAKKGHIVEEQAKCNSDEAIPLHYEPINKAKSDKDSDSTNKRNSKTVVSPQRQSKCHGKGSSSLQMTSMKVKDTNDRSSWHDLLKALLFRKASLTYLAVIKSCLKRQSYVEAFKYVRTAFHCFDAMKRVVPEKGKENAVLLASLYNLCGEIRFFLLNATNHNVDEDEALVDTSDEGSTIQALAEKELDSCEYVWALEETDDTVAILSTCVNCCRKALDLISRQNPMYIDIAKRKGNALNELGVQYMKRAHGILQSEDVVKEITDRPSDYIESLWRDSLDYLQQGIETFKDVQDVANQVLLHCNIGRLMMLCADTYTYISNGKQRPEFTLMERCYFNKAIDHFTTAWSLGEQGLEGVRAAIEWQLSSAYFKMATLLQDNMPCNAKQTEVVQEVSTLMDKALKYCRSGIDGATGLKFQYRAATIHHKLGSMFHNSIRQQCSNQRHKHHRHLAETHYDQAVNLFKKIGMECHTELLRVQLEHVALLEYTLDTLVTVRSRLSVLQQALHCLVDCDDCLLGMSQQLEENEAPVETKVLQTRHREIKSLTDILESRIQFILLHMIKAYKTVGSKKSKETSVVMTELKAVYAASLGGSKVKGGEEEILKSKCQFLQGLVKQLSVFYYGTLVLVQDSSTT